jgi:hypothetical protein
MHDRRCNVGARPRLALSQAMSALPYYLHTYPMIVEQAWRWLAEALADS